MTDRELLELAALAASIEVVPFYDGLHDVSNDSNKIGKIWNPLTDDGDALRLAVKMQLSIESDAHIEVGFDPGIGGEYEVGCEAWIVHAEGTCTKAQEVYNADPCAATRRAIVRVAAEIGAQE